MLVVCAAITYKGDKILIAQRGKGTHLEFQWEFPGGKIEEGESPEECIVRELKEELDIDVSVKNVFDVVFHKFADKNILLIDYECEYISGEPKPIECNDFRWISIEEMDSYNFTEADREIVEKLKKRHVKL
jgi:8-oxo-dGTP diphosphatase